MAPIRQSSLALRHSIIVEGKKLAALHRISEDQVNVSELARKMSHLGVSRKKVARWWGRREQFDQTGVLHRKSGSGRKIHKSFRSSTARRRSINLLETLKIGEHKHDAAMKLGCHRNTITNHLGKDSNWLLPPRVDVSGLKVETKAKRLQFAKHVMQNERDEMSQEMQDCTTIDHKIVSAFGQNRSHQKQFRMKDSSRILRPVLSSQSNPSVMVLFAANSKGTDLYIHADKRKNANGRWQMINRKINGEEMAKGVEEKIAPFMVKSFSSLAFMDCNRTNYSPPVAEKFDEVNIEVIQPASRPYNTGNGSPRHLTTLQFSMEICFLRL